MAKVQPVAAPGRAEPDVAHREARARVVALVGELFDLLATPAALVPTHPTYATIAAHPCGSTRAWKAACASGAFPTFRQGKRVAALWTAVAAYVEGRALPVRRVDASLAEDHDDRAALEAAGVRLRPAANGVRTKARRDL